MKAIWSLAQTTAVGRSGIARNLSTVISACSKAVIGSIVYSTMLSSGLRPACRAARRMPRAPLCALRDPQRPVDESDPAVPEVEEVAGGEIPASGVVDRDRAQLAVPAPPVEQHDEGPALPQGLEMADAPRRRADHDALDPLLLEPAQVARLSVRGAVRGAEDHRSSLLVHRVLQPPHRLGGERVGGVEHDGAEAPAVAAAPHLVGGGAPHEAERVDRLEDSRQGVGAHAIRPVQHVRRRAERDAGVLGDVADGHPSPAGQRLARNDGSSRRTLPQLGMMGSTCCFGAGSTVSSARLAHLGERHPAVAAAPTVG